MNMIDAARIQQLLPWDRLINRLEGAFIDGAVVPPRHHHTIEQAHQTATLLLMPAWQQDGYIGIKNLTVFPANSQRNLPAIHGIYQLFDGETGALLALLDGNELTRRRTAAASALASGYLSHPDSKTLLICGTGKLAPMLIEAHAAVRPIERLLVHGRSPHKAAALASQYTGYTGAFSAITDSAVITTEQLPIACQQADIISCATLASSPIIKGDWLTPGVHLDLVGAFTPQMRETDGHCLEKAQVFVDTFEGARHEAGDLLQAAAEGRFEMASIIADLGSLCRQEVSGRIDKQAITLFKSTGTALEDLAAAIEVYERSRTETDVSSVQVQNHM